MEKQNVTIERTLEVFEVSKFSIMAIILKSKTEKTQKVLRGFVLFEEVGNFRVFQVFDYKPYTGIEYSKNTEIFSRLVNFKESVLIEEVGKFRHFRVFNFGTYTEIQGSENSEIYSRLVNLSECVLFENFRNF